MKMHKIICCPLVLHINFFHRPFYGMFLVSLLSKKASLQNLNTIKTNGIEMSIFMQRIIRASKLDPSLYEEVEADSTALLPAMLVVTISSLAAGFGTVQQIGPRGILFGTATALVGWFVWSFLTFFIGTRILPETQTEADYGQLLRTIGFSSAPGIIRILGLIPVIGFLSFFISSIWMLAAMIVAVRQALDYTSTWRAVAVCAIGWAFQLAVLIIMSSFLYRS